MEKIKTEAKEAILKKLLKAGHGIDRTEKIIKEVETSSNPSFLLHYWGIKNPEDYLQQEKGGDNV